MPDYGVIYPNQPDLRLIVMAKIPFDRDGNVAVNVYVRLPTAGKYICWVKRGDVITTEQRERILEHSDPRLYCPIKDWEERYKFIDLENSDKLGEDAQEIVTDLFTSLLDENAEHENAVEHLAAVSATIAENIVKDLKGYENKVLKEIEDISRMEDSYAIRSLCILFAIPFGFSSKTAIIDISNVSLFMDSPLLDFTKDEVETFYLDPDAVSANFLAAYEKHPAKAHSLASEKLKIFSEQSLLMILNHHELHNGQGFPRKSQTRSLPDLVKLMSYAVDVFERLKKSDLEGEKIGLKTALKECYQVGVDPHLKRHHVGLMDKVLAHLEIEKPE